ncbi:MAG: hypothetical protein AAF198_13420 [Pseudomonadota bacterium]
MEKVDLVAPVAIGRKWFGVLSLGFPATLIVAIMIQGSITHVLSAVILLAIAALFMWAAWRMWNAPHFGIVFDGDSLKTEDGATIAKMSEIQSVQVGLFVMRPSNGFMMMMKQPGIFPTRPGVVWRQGRRIGIGGILRSSEAKSIGRAIQVELDRLAHK